MICLPVIGRNGKMERKGARKMNEIAANIRSLRRKKGWSQEQLAQALHVTRQTVSAWERGISLPALDALGEIARALEVEPERLLYGDRSGKKPRYRHVSAWPVLGLAVLFYVMVFWLLPIPLSWVVGAMTDTAFLLGGQLFLTLVIGMVYYLLKDEIRNRDFYADQEGNPSDKEG